MCRATIVILSSKPKYLEPAIKGAINQTYPVFKIIVRDDKQSDEIKRITETLMESCEKLSYVRNDSNLKELGSWLEAVKSCDTEFLLAVHDDDILHPSIVEEQIKVFDMMENVIQVTTDMTNIDETGQVIRETECDGSIEVFRKNEYAHYLCETLSNKIASPTVMVRVSSVKEYAYDENFIRMCVDDLNRSVLLNNIGDVCILHKSLCYYRRHSNQGSFRVYTSRWDTVDLIMPLIEQICGHKKAMLFRCWAMSRRYDTKIILDIKDEFSEYYKSEKDTRHNALFYNFLMRILYLRKAFKEKTIEAVIWGAGSAGQTALEMIHTYLPNVKVTGFIDRDKKGDVLDLSVCSPEDFDYKSGKYIFVCISGNGAFEAFSTLVDKGLTIGEDFIGGYGVSAFIDINRYFGM